MNHSFLKGCFLVVSSLALANANAQDKKVLDTYTDAEGNQWEITAAATDNNQKTDYNGSPSTQKSDFDGGWFFQAFKFIQWLIDHGNAGDSFLFLKDKK